VLNLRLQSTAAHAAINGVKVVVYGRAGMGKTTLCATCPSPVIFSAESGLMSLRQFDLPFYEIKTVADLRDAYQWSKDSAEARQFATICVDSISDVAETLLGSIKVGKKDPRQAYGEYNDEILKVLKDFRDLPGKNVYMSAKQERYKTPEGLVLNAPSLPGQKAGQALPYLPDLILQLDVDPTGGYRYLRCKPDFANDAKDRSGVLGVQEEPHLGKIFARVTGRQF
jgi:hypothetical protein